MDRRVKRSSSDDAVLFHGQAVLVEFFRMLYPDDFEFEGRRAIVLTVGKPLPEASSSHGIARVLTYRLSPA